MSKLTLKTVYRAHTDAKLVQNGRWVLKDGAWRRASASYVRLERMIQCS
jgi:hypothetical protein